MTCQASGQRRGHGSLDGKVWNEKCLVDIVLCFNLARMLVIIEGMWTTIFWAWWMHKIHACLPAYLCTSTYTRPYVFAYVRTSIRTDRVKETHMHIHIHTHTHIYTCTYTHIYIHTYTYIQIHTHTCMHACMHAIHPSIHPSIHPCIHYIHR